MTYRLLIFDFDGTLADSFPVFLRSYNAVADRYRFRRLDDPAELDHARTLDARRLLKHLRLPFWKLPFVARTFRRLMTEAADEVPLFEGIPELLRNLTEAGIELAIVSSNTEANVRRILGTENAARIRYLVGGTAILGKARAFRWVLRRSGRQAAEVLCIGDELRDWEAARAVGLAFGAVDWGYTRFGALPDAGTEWLRFAEVPAIARAVL